MKCDEAQIWLLSSRDDDSAPPPVQDHLDGCAACISMRQSLTQIDSQVRDLPLPRSNPVVRAQMWHRLPDRPETASPIKPPPSGIRSPAWRRGWLAAAAVLLFALGCIVGHSIGVGRDGDRQTDVGIASANDRKPVDVRILELVAAMSAATSEEDRIELLGDMAEELHSEVVILVERRELDQLPLLTGLYDTVVKDGLARAVAGLPEARRAAAVAPLLEQLRSAEEQMASLTDKALPAVAELVRPLQTSTQEAVELLRAGKAPVSRPASLPGQEQPLVAHLVHQGLRLATEQDPVRRADLSAELSPRVATAVVHLSVQGAPEQSANLELGLAELMENGVVSNLERAKPPVDKPGREADLERMRKKAAQAMEVLEKNLANARAIGRAGLQRAFEASKEGKPPMGMPPWLRPGNKHMPFGHFKPPKKPGGRP